MKKLALLLSAAAIFGSCSTDVSSTSENPPPSEGRDYEALVEQYAPFTLTADLSELTENERQMIPLLIEAAQIMDGLFWVQAYGDRDSLLVAIDDANARTYTEYNYGPWDRLNGDETFIPGVGEKPAGANFYPTDMNKEEFEAANLENKESLYTFLRRDENGNLETVWYHDYFTEELERAASLLRQAAELAEDPGLKKYLTARAEALVTDEYYDSDVAWMQMKNNTLDVVIGAIETYEDQLFGYKAGYEAYVLVKDKDWSDRLAKYASFLPMLQRELPVEEKYKRENPGTNSDLNAYDVIYYSGHSNAGSKTIAINLPNDENIQMQYGSRRLQLKNAMRAKFDKILVPISEVLIADDQQQHVTFDAFFANTMFHEVAHGLGIKNTINGNGTVREALKEHASALEEGKADILGVYMITKLHEQGELAGEDLMDYYVTFLAGIFRSVRFGASSAHGKANMVRFNYFRDMGAFTKQEDGKYRVNFEAFQQAIDALSRDILVLQGEGDYAGTGRLLNEQGQVGEELQQDLDKLQEANIPVDITFEQGVDVLDL